MYDETVYVSENLDAVDRDVLKIAIREMMSSLHLGPLVISEVIGGGNNKVMLKVLARHKAANDDSHPSQVVYLSGLDQDDVLIDFARLIISNSDECDIEARDSVIELRERLVEHIASEFNPEVDTYAGLHLDAHNFRGSTVAAHRMVSNAIDRMTMRLAFEIALQRG